MATYAAYRHVELDNVGYGKKRVLKPPGGGSSDIFGAAPEETSPRRVKNHNQSQLGSALFGDGPNTGHNEPLRSTSKPGNDSYNRLFGPPDAPPTTPNAKNHMRSNIPLSGDSSMSSSSSSTSSSSSGAATSPAKSTANNDSPSAAVSNGLANNLTNDITDGNPVTGTGYTPEAQNNGPMQNGTSSSSSEKSNDASPAGKAASRTRVPPGGYSSGLW